MRISILLSIKIVLRNGLMFSKCLSAASFFTKNNNMNDDINNNDNNMHDEINNNDINNNSNIEDDDRGSIIISIIVTSLTTSNHC